MDVFEYTRLADDGCPNCRGHAWLLSRGWFPPDELVQFPLPIVHSDFVFDIKILEVSRVRG